MRSLRTLATALFLTPLVAVSLPAFGLRRTQAWMSRWPAPRRPRAPAGAATARAREVARAVGLAAAHGPVRASCLRRALVAWWLLRREGIPVAIRIGVRRDGTSLTSHAWIEHVGMPVGDPPETVASYASFEADFAAMPEPGP